MAREDIAEIQAELEAVKALMSSAEDTPSSTQQNPPTEVASSDIKKDAGSAQNTSETKSPPLQKESAPASPDNPSSQKSPPSSGNTKESSEKSTVEKVVEGSTRWMGIALQGVVFMALRGPKFAAKFLQHAATHSDKSYSELKNRESELESELQKARDKNAKKDKNNAEKGAGGANIESSVELTTAMFEKIFLNSLRGAKEQGLNGKDAIEHALSQTRAAANMFSASDVFNGVFDKEALAQEVDKFSQKYANSSETEIDSRIGQINQAVDDFVGSKGYNDKESRAVVNFFKDQDYAKRAHAAAEAGKAAMQQEGVTYQSEDLGNSHLPTQRDGGRNNGIQVQ